jgi:adenine-specific DNA-methyltransferase
MASDPGDIVLDFHLGSGTTCSVAHKTGRQYVGIEQLNYGGNDPVVRLTDVVKGEKTGISKAINWQGGGDFVYMELAKWNENWVNKIKSAKTEKELQKILDEMKGIAFLSYKVDPKTIDANAKEFGDLSIADQKKFLIECLDKNQLYVNLSEIEDRDYGVSEGDKKMNSEFYE